MVFLRVAFERGPALFEHGNTDKRALIAADRTVSIGERTVLITLAYDQTRTYEMLATLGWILVAFVLFLTALVGAILWTVLSRWVLAPLSGEIDRQTLQLKRLNHAYRALGESNMALLTAESEQDLLERVCQIVSDDCGYETVWIGYASMQPNSPVQIRAHHGKALGYMHNLTAAQEASAPFMRSLQERKAIVVNHIADEAAPSAWRDRAQKNRIGSLGAFPIRWKNRTLGVMEVCAAQSGAFVESEVRLLSELADNLAFGIAALRDRKRIEELSVTDPLTGLYNRSYIDQALKSEQARFVRYQKPFSVALLDIDHFKEVNDTFGHPTGDAVLKTLSALLQKHRRQIDVVGRWGGEEFIVILPGTDEAAAGQFAERIRTAIETTVFEKVKTLTVSIGIAQSAPEATIQTLIKQADEALYRAKEGGRNRVVAAKAR